MKKIFIILVLLCVCVCSFANEFSHDDYIVRVYESEYVTIQLVDNYNGYMFFLNFNTKENAQESYLYIINEILFGNIANVKSDLASWADEIEQIDKGATTYTTFTLYED